MFRYHEYPVSLLASGYIKKCWVLDNSRSDTALGGKQVLPNGCFNIAFIQGTGIDISGAKGHHFLRAGVYLCGQLTTSIQIHLHGYTKIFLVQFYPWAPAYFLEDSLNGTADLFVPLELLAHRLELTFDITVDQLVLAYFNQYFSQVLLPVTPALQACQLIREYRGNITMQAVAGEFGRSGRYLETMFKDSLGISPKTYAGIIRIRSLIDQLQTGAYKSRLTAMALEQGFYDQAHFIKYFKSIVSISPGKFQAENYLLSLHGGGY
ncbi:MAG: helix-turn-helix transcriptional regulator [Chitinophaga sp.]|uniref:helix-turn-helix transcriptional regulator n=1 Tax=Chitinophaga sp. TaxID=1869181 RepID=UPI0025BB111E|nr:helix-turn-helix transcriptional regulator [Chitinophaga sp.]MBV8253722.1 helix-turn-helix transcriptional regulator [Chitinophaga sp.]